MSRYIDADKIEYEDMLRPRGDGNYEECQIAYRDHIDDIPTADVRENVRGEWIKKEGSLWTLATCSVCGKLSVDGDKPFCPNCGAEMIERIE